MNQVILEGVLITDIDIVTTSGRNRVAKFRLHTDDEGIGANGTVFRAKESHMCVAWNDDMAAIERCQKGDILRVEGRIASRSYEDPDKKPTKQWVREIILHKAEVLPGKGEIPEYKRHQRRDSSQRPSRERPDYDKSTGYGSDDIPF